MSRSSGSLAARVLEPTAPAARSLSELVRLPTAELEREVARCEALILDRCADEREYAAFVSGTRELARRAKPDTAGT